MLAQWLENTLSLSTPLIIIWVASYFVIVPVLATLIRRRLVKAFEASERRYKDTVENAIEGIIKTTWSGKFLSVNPAFARMLGYDSSEELLARINDISHQIYVDPEVRADFLRRLMTYKRARCEYEAWKKGGTTTWLRASSRCVEDDRGNFLYYESIVEDISERKSKEEELKKLANSLARSNADLARFAHTVAHDLTQPLRTVRSYGQLLERQYQDKLGPGATVYLRYMSNGIDRMRNFIDDILDFAQVNNRPCLSESVDLNELCYEVLQDLKGAIEEAQASVFVDKLPTVSGDRTKLGRLFQNLLSNSLKFRRNDPLVIRISSSSARTQWQISVSDNGIGFDLKDREKVFELFVRLGDRSQYPGTGMGLAVCRRIVEVHGGCIWADSQTGLGSTFHFTLPDCSPRREKLEGGAQPATATFSPEFVMPSAKREEDVVLSCSDNFPQPLAGPGKR